MKVYVNKNKVKLEKNYIINRGEYKANQLEFVFSDEYEGLIKKALFVDSENEIEETINNNVCDIPAQMLNSKKFELRVYAYEMQGDVLVLRYSPTFAKVFTREGSYNAKIKPTVIQELNITPLQREQHFDGLYNKVNVEAIDSEELNITPSQEEQTFTGLYDTVNVEAIPPIEADTLNATSSTQNQSFTGLYDEVNIAGIQTDTLNITPSQTQQQFTGLYDEVNVGAIQAETLNVTPTKEAQTRTGLYNQVNVSGDNNLVAGNIKKNVSIFGVTGSYEETPNLQAKSLTITENGTQTVSPDTGYDGLSSVAITTNVSGTAEKAVLPSATSLSFRNGRFANTDFLKLLDTSKMSIAQNMFQNCIYIQTIPLIDTSNMVYMQNMFSECYELTSIPSLDTSKVTTMQGFCYDDRSLLSVPQLNTSKVTNMSQAFYGCKRITEFPLLDTGLVTGFYETFSKCEGLVSMPQLNTINATDMTRMFNECSSLSEESLNNILAICITASKISSTNKNLKYIGLTSAQATTCQGLSNYQAFLDAGWTTGY